MNFLADALALLLFCIYMYVVLILFASVIDPDPMADLFRSLFRKKAVTSKPSKPHKDCFDELL